MKSEQKFRLAFILCDFFAAVIALLLFSIVRFYITKDYGDLRNVESFTIYLRYSNVRLGQFIFPFLIVGLCYLSGFYNKPLEKQNSHIFLTTLVTAILSTLTIYFIILINDNLPIRSINYELLGSLCGILFGLLYLPRSIVAKVISEEIRVGQIRFNTLVIGNETESASVVKAINDSEKSSGYHIVSICPIDTDANTICNIAIEKGVNTIVIIPGDMSNAQTLHLISHLFHLGIQIKIAPETYDIITSNIRHANIKGIPFVNIAQSNMPEWQKSVKRATDIICSAIALIILLPVFAVISILVKRSSSGNVFYTQERIGRNGKPFNIYKFRTMVANAESNGVPQLSNETDLRVTDIGRVLRKYRLDETPQFWNVLKGDMSLVGPRPEREYFAEQIIARAPYYTLVYQIRPGLTSWGVVKYGYAQNVDEMITRSKYDLIYLENMSLLVDLKIIMYTIKTVATGKGI